MTKQEDNSNKRKFKRLSPQKNILVYNSEILGQVLDISKGGLSFAYREETARINDLFLDLNLICRDQELSISSLFCKAISDIALEDESLAPDGNIRRCGVQFSTLTDAQSHLLEQFLAPQMDESEESNANDDSNSNNESNSNDESNSK